MAQPVDKAFASPLKGVSQQNPRDRIDGQCSEQINLLADPVRSLTRRSPVEYLLTLRDADSDIQDIQFNYNSVRYSLGVKQGEATLYNLYTKEEYTHSGVIPEYVNNKMKMAVSTDVLLLVNTTKITAISDATDTFQNKEALITNKGGYINNTYSIKVTIDKVDYTSTYKPTDASTATADNVMQKLYEGFNNNSSFKALCDIKVAYDVIYLSLKDKTKSFNVATADGYAGKAMLSITSKVKTVDDLPRFAVSGFNILVEQTPEKKTDNYYMEFVYLADTGEFGDEGAWVETVAPNLKNNFDLSTMPHKITIDDTAKTFTIAQAAWLPRQVGDTKTNPVPSFIGNTINDISMVQGRMCMVSKSVFMTRSKELLDCYRNSATVLVDSDPIDIKNSTVDDAPIRDIVQYNKNVAFYAQNVQFLMDGSSVLSPATAAVPVSSRFSSDACSPVATGTSVIHSYQKGSYVALKEIFPSTDVIDTPFDDITEQVENYIKGRCKKIVSNTSFDNVFVLSDKENNTVYVYRYLYNNNEKLLSAWCKYVFPFAVDDINSYEDTLYVTYTAGGKTYIGTISLDFAEDTTIGYTIYLDNRCTIDIVNGVGTLPYLPTISGYECVMRQVYDSNGVLQPLGLPLTINSIVGSTITLNDTSVSGKAIVGLPTYWEYRPTRPFLKDNNDVVIDTGRLNVLQYIAAVSRTASFYIGIYDSFNNNLELEISSNALNSTLSSFDRINLSDEAITIPFYREADRYNIKFYGNNFMPFTLLDLEWIGKWYNSGRRL